VLFPGQIAAWYLQGNPNGSMSGFANLVQKLVFSGQLFASILYALLVMGFTYFIQRYFECARPVG
jgi:hypothetical protein